MMRRPIFLREQSRLAEDTVGLRELFDHQFEKGILHSRLFRQPPKFVLHGPRQPSLLLPN